MKRVVLVLAVMALAGCSALGIGNSSTGGAKKNVARESTAINCGGFSNWGDCSAKAAQMCPKGYEMIRRDEDVISQRRIMYITCN